MQDFEYLSFGDALFLLLERQVAPLNIASVSVFDGAMDYKSLLAFIEARLPLAPRFLQRVVPAPLNIGLPHWEPDANFNIRNHIREVRLRRGTEVELRNLAGRILSCVMDRSRPLWDLTLVHGLKQDRTAIIIRAHHAMADGVSGVALLDILMDSTPITKKPRRVKLARKVVNSDPITSAAGDFINWWLSSVGRVLTVETEVLQMAQKMMSALSVSSEADDQSPSTKRSEIDSLRSLLPEIATPSIRLPFNKVCRGPQRFTWTEIPFDRIRKVKTKAEVTVNDVVLTVVSAAYRDFAELMGAKIAGHELRVVIPVNTRESTAGPDLGNQITFAPINVPLQIRNLTKLMSAVREQTTRMKSTGLAQLVGMAGRLLGVIPPPLQAAIAPIISQLPISLCNVICTNIPGPKEPRYMMGHKMLQCYPYVPIGGEMALNCAVLTYNGTAYFGFSADMAIAGELERIAAALNDNFDRLERSLGLSAPARKQKARPSVRKRLPRPISVSSLKTKDAAGESTGQVPQSLPVKTMAVAAG